jgi:hypothetical protein
MESAVNVSATKCGPIILKFYINLVNSDALRKNPNPESLRNRIKKDTNETT